VRNASTRSYPIFLACKFVSKPHCRLVGSNRSSSALHEWSITADIPSHNSEDLLLLLSLRNARLLVLLVPANEIVHISLCLSELHLIHPLTSVPM